MLLSESYKNRLKELAGIKSLIEAMDSNSKTAAMNKSSDRFNFSIDSMEQAINQGREIGLNFQSRNSKYTMPTTKSRIIWPVALGTDKNGNLVVRGYHVVGQSEKKAIETGIRSAEAIDEWRLFKVDNIKSMWFTDNFFSQPLPGYKERDSAMISMIASYNPSKARAYQDSVNNQIDNPVNTPNETPIVEPPKVDSNKENPPTARS
jgi:hypothetical protein